MKLFINRKYKAIDVINNENRNMLHNLIFSKSLEFGKNWMKPIESIVKKNLPNLKTTYIEELSRYIEVVRGDIFKKMYDLYWEYPNREQVDHNAIESTILVYIEDNYPWINNENIKRAVSEGFYYAWRG